MAYGILKCDNITFDNGGSDQNVTVSGLYRATTSGVTLSGTIAATTVSGVTVIGSTTVSGATVTGTTANFTSGNFSNLISSAATMSGALIMANQQQVRFREAVGNGTNHIALQAPAVVSADQTITLPDQTGTVVTTGDNGSVTSTMILDGTILNADINASAAIAGTKISPDFGSQTIVTTGVHSAAAGSAAAPSIAFTGDLNTGIYSPGADQLAVSTGGTGRLFVDASGNVGVGAGPTNVAGSKRIDIGEAGVSNGLLTLRSSGGAQEANISCSATGLVFTTNSYATPFDARASEIILGTGTSGTPRLRIDSSGNVGIGTSSPEARLQVSAPSTGRSYSSSVLDFSNIHLDGITADATTSALTFSSGGGGGAAIAFSRGGSFQTEMSFWTCSTASANSATERLRIDSSGRVGIGTSTPGEKLTIAGTSGSAAISLLETGVRNWAIRAGGALTNTLDVADLTAGATRLTIDSSGNVGIGTSSPTFVSGGGLAIYKVGDARITLKNNTTGDGSATGAGLVYSGVNLTVNNQEAGFTAFTTAGTERLRIDSSGNVGIGTASPGSPLDVFGGGIRSTDSAGNARSKFEVFTNGQSSNQVTLGQGFGGPTDNVGYLYNRANAALVLGTNDTERLRIDSSGRLLVGTSSARANIFDNVPLFQVESAGQAFGSITGNLNNAGGAVLLLSKSRGGVVGGTTIVNNGDEIGQITFSASDGSALRPAAKITAEVDGTPGANDMPGRLVFSTTADGAASPTERMRISQNGNAYIGTTADLVSDTNRFHVSGTRAIVGRATGGAAIPVITSWNDATSGDNIFVSFRTETADTERGTIDYNRAGGQVRYNVTSDSRLKSEIQPAASALDDLAAIQVRAYKWTETDYQINYGFVAQELNEVAPDAVKEGDYGEEITNVWAVDNSKLVPLLTKALQEAIAKIESLESKVAALEAA